MSKGDNINPMGSFFQGYFLRIKGARQNFFRLPFLCVVLILLLAAFIALTPTPAVAETRLQVTSDTVNIRSGPSTIFDKLTAVNKGDTFRVLQESGGWYQIELANNALGWIIADYVKISTDSTLPATITLASGTVNIRSGPATTYDKIGAMSAGDKLTVSGESGYWYIVSYNNSKGYVAKWLVKANFTSAGSGTGTSTATVALPASYQKAKVNTDNLNLRSGPDTTSEKISQLAKGTQIAIYERQGKWYSVLAATGEKGWVYSDYVNLENIKTTSVAAEACSKPQWNESGDTVGKIVLSCKSTSYGVRVILQGDAYIAYTLEENDNGLLFTSDMAISGDLPREDYLSAKIKGDAENKIHFYYEDTVSYDVTVDDNGRKVVIEFSASPIVGKIIYIDPGHGSISSTGGIDPGASGNGLAEKDIVLDISQKTVEILQSWGADARITRDGNTNYSLSDRAAVANAAGADIFVSIHCNSATNTSAKGTSTWLYAPSGNTVYDRDARLLLAQKVLQSILASCPLSNYGVHEENFLVLRETLMPAILVETAFISNASDAALLGNEDFRQTMATAIATGIREYFIEISK